MFLFSTLSPLAQFVRTQNALQSSVVTTGHPRAFSFVKQHENYSVSFHLAKLSPNFGEVKHFW